MFWLAVEDLKDTIDSERTCAAKIRRIKRRFFRAGADISMWCVLCEVSWQFFSAVHCQDAKMFEVVATLQPSAFQLMDAQEAVATMLEESW